MKRTLGKKVYREEGSLSFLEKVLNKFRGKTNKRVLEKIYQENHMIRWVAECCLAEANSTQSHIRTLSSNLSTDKLNCVCFRS